MSFGRTDWRTMSLLDKVMSTRLNLLNTKPFYGNLLMVAQLSVVDDGDKKDMKDILKDLQAAMGREDLAGVFSEINEFNKHKHTACVDSYGHLVLYKSFADKLTYRQLSFLMMHEVLHLALMHFLRTPPSWSHEIANIAQDLVVNDILMNETYANGLKFTEKDTPGYNEGVRGTKGLIPTPEHTYTFANIPSRTKKGEKITYTIHDLNKKSAEQVYLELVHILPPPKKQQHGGGGGGGDKDQKGSKGKGAGKGSTKGDNTTKNSGSGGGSSDPMDKHQGFDQHISQPNRQNKDGSDKSQMQLDQEMADSHATWIQAVQNAMTAARNRGLMSAHLESLLGEVLTPKIPWQAELKRYIIAGAPADWHWGRPGRRSVGAGTYMPALKNESLELIVHADESGSVPDVLLEAFFAEVHGMLRAYSQVTVTLIVCDYAIHEVIQLNKRDVRRKLTKRKAHGGTSHAPVVDWILNNNKRKKARVFISLTDAESDIQTCYPRLPKNLTKLLVLPYESKGYKTEMQKYATKVIILPPVDDKQKDE